MGFISGVLILSITILVAWLSGDTGQLGRADPAYGLPIIVGAWLLFTPVRRLISEALFGK